jgi:hypothetical protein
MSSNRVVRPWDLFNSKIPKLTPELAQERYDICTDCEHFIKLTTQCKKCGCLMKAKTTLAEAFCPVGKWQAAKPE